MNPKTEERIVRCFVFACWPLIAALLAVCIAIVLVGVWFSIPFMPLTRTGPWQFKYSRT